MNLEGLGMKIRFPNKKNGVIALGFFILELMVVVRNWETDYWFFYWYCDFVPIVFSFLFFFEKPQAIKGLLYIGFLGQAAFNISLASEMLFGFACFHFVTLQEGMLLVNMVTLAMHMSTLCAFFAVAREKPEKAALTWSFAFIVTIYAAVMLLTDPQIGIDFNFNYVYWSDLLVWIPWLTPWYTVLWIPLVFICVALPMFGGDLLMFYLLQKQILQKRTRVVMRPRVA